MNGGVAVLVEARLADVVQRVLELVVERVERDAGGAAVERDLAARLSHLPRCGSAVAQVRPLPRCSYSSKLSSEQTLEPGGRGRRRPQGGLDTGAELQPQANVP